MYAITTGPELNKLKAHLLHRLIAVHVAYRKHQKEIAMFSQLTTLSPGLVTTMMRKKFS